MATGTATSSKYSGRMGNPEDSIKLLAKAKQNLAAGLVPATKPIWNTEINYGMQSGSLGGTKAATITAERQAAYVIRTYLLNAARGIKRVYWYSYDMSYLPSGGTLGNTRLTDPDAKAVASQVIDRLGYDTYDVGPLAEGWRYQRDTPAYAGAYVDGGDWENPRPASAALMADKLAAAQRYRAM